MNEVEEYLYENKGKKIGIKKMHRDLYLKKRQILYQIKTSSHIKQVKPIEVGSGKYNVLVFTYV